MYESTLNVNDLTIKKVLKDNFLIEIPKSQSYRIPADWLKINSTKRMTRWRSPELEEIARKVSLLEESLEEHCIALWEAFIL